MDVISVFLTVALVHFLAVVSPGPDFILITRNSLVYSRKTGIYSALGLGLGILVHVTYSLIGVGLLISKSIVLFSLIKFIGAGYLIYIGYKSLTSKHTKQKELTNHKKLDLSPISAVKMGFITNVTNPKATLFFLSLFTLVISPQTPLGIKLLMGTEMSIVTFLWFAFLAMLFTQEFVKNKVSRVQHLAEKLMGGVLIALGVRLAFSTTK